MRLVKYVIALFYLLGGPALHGFFIRTNLDIYATIADQAMPLYQTLWASWVMPNLLLLLALLMLFEVVTGGLMLSARKPLPEVGQLAGAIFNLLLIPFWFAYGIPNLVFALVHLWLFWGEWRNDIVLTPIHI